MHSYSHRRFSGVTAGVATALSAGAALFAGGALATRPPCPEGYVRLIDVLAIWPVVSGVRAALSLILALFSVWRGDRPARVVLSVLAVVVSGLLLVGAVGIWQSLQGATYDPSCWTF
ncbi:MAG TPA: hypothetical protein VG435_17025 [Acidimicrobiales bacterium]|jgi:hypothetical protein|nr:hypothetical protein [Acidimicrobiales bacterium]